MRTTALEEYEAVLYMKVYIYIYIYISALVSVYPVQTAIVTKPCVLIILDQILSFV